MKALLITTALFTWSNGLLGGAVEGNQGATTKDQLIDGSQVRAQYVLAASDEPNPPPVTRFSTAWGARELVGDATNQWFQLHVTKHDRNEFNVWLLAPINGSNLPDATHIARYILQAGAVQALEFRDPVAIRAVLPSAVRLARLLPAPVEPVPGKAFPDRVWYLGWVYRLERTEKVSETVAPPTPRVVNLRPDLWVGAASNTRQKERARRYDGSEYELVPLVREDYREMARAGITCVKVDRSQLDFVRDLDMFYWGVGPADVPYPEALYDSRYLGPGIFLDEPAVHTRDYVLRPRLAKDPELRRALNPQIAFDAFSDYFAKALNDAQRRSLFRGLASGAVSMPADLRGVQENLYSWETMVSTAGYQLSQDATTPSAIVFEPPGRVGTRRTLPELNMTYGCQIPADNSNYLIDIIYGFLRGAARLAGKHWGTSIYGAVDRADAFGYLTRAYDLGATRFFFWDNAQLACVPFDECLGLARALKARAENHPFRDLDRLTRAAETVIVLPAGYNLGHVSLGKGNLWGLSELNLERTNPSGVKYRTVMGNFFTEIERCLRLGTAFDLLGDFPGLQPQGYREVVRIREDGKVEITRGADSQVLDGSRSPLRPEGAPPELAVSVSADAGKAPLRVSARAVVTETLAPVYYTFGADTEGVYHNAAVAWELYGPGEEDHRFLTPLALKPRITHTGAKHDVQVEFQLDRPGEYRLRAATVDLAGRSRVVWTSLRAD